MSQVCSNPWCQKPFDVTEGDLAALARLSPMIGEITFSLPPPTQCPDCRLLSRLTFRNERSLYRRHCSGCGKMIVCMFPGNAEYSVYCHDCWWADSFEPLAYGRLFDFTRSLSDQLSDLLHSVPLPHLVIGACENSEFTNYSWQNKDSYLLSSSDYCEDCYYGTYVMHSRDCIDCTFVTDSELCYQCVDVRSCYRCTDLIDCLNCSECSLCEHCTSCTSCTGCTGLHRRQFCLFNEQLSEEEYRAKTASMSRELLRTEYERFRRTAPQPYATLEACEQSTGDHLRACKHAVHCFDLVEAEDCAYCALGLKPKNCMDATGVPGSQHCYQVAACPEDYGLHSCAVIWPTSNALQYCLFSRASQHCFGCVSLNKNSYCILNQQYSKEEYEALVPRIIEHMKATPLPPHQSGAGSAGQEWGAFFPVSLSPFGYNETVAYETFPITREEAHSRNWHWYDGVDAADQYLGPRIEIAPNIQDVPDEITKQVLLCSVTQKPYKIIPQELTFYRTMNLPVPRKCPDQRHRERMALRNPRKLWKRTCAKCGAAIETTYAPERPEIVYCEQCYLSSVY